MCAGFGGREVTAFVKKQEEILRDEILVGLEGEGVHLVNWEDLTDDQKGDVSGLKHPKTLKLQIPNTLKSSKRQPLTSRPLKTLNVGGNV